MATKRIERRVIFVTLMVAVTLLICMTSCKNVTDNASTPTTSVAISKVGTDSQGVMLKGKEYSKTQEKVVIAKGTTATIKKATDTSWTDYGDKGVFVTGRQVTLSPFIMGKYEVTQELYEAVMGTNPSFFVGDKRLPADGETQGLRPVELVTWYDAVIFCNELTEQTMGAENCVYSVNKITKDDKGIITSATVTADHTKKGYRLPTEAEWEFAARGGNPKDTKWGYAYAGVQTTNPPTNSFTYDADSSLNDFGWYGSNSDDKTHEVGTTLKQNALGLCDMSGNVWEWCYDWYDESLPLNVTNPEGATSGTARVNRGGGGTSMRTAVLFLSETVTIQLLLLITLVFVFAVPICKFDAVQESRLGEFVIKLPHPFFLL